MASKDCSNRQEIMVADTLGWHRVKGSGSRPTYPGDVVSEDWVGECKTHIRESNTVTVQLADWAKLQTECGFKQPVLFIDNGTQKPNNTWCLVKSLPVIFISTDVPTLNANKIIRINKVSITFKLDKLLAYHEHVVAQKAVEFPILYDVSKDGVERYLMWFPDFVNMVNKEYS